ncbi:MAG: hypothetical protein KDK89_05850 [Alphaproteobacteria bacterium]|nr:hypothetical protein [Alphaproteobacteria bacterium]
MFRKTALALAALLALSFAETAPARADVDINIDLGFGGFYGRNISCRQGFRIVDRRFYRVRVVECSGRTYRYIGWRRGHRYLIHVSAYSGRIVQVRRY